MKQRRYLTLLAVVLFTVTYGCTSTKSLNTPSGDPEVTISYCNPEKVKSSLIKNFREEDFHLVSASDRLMEFERPIQGTRAFFYKVLTNSTSAKYGSKIVINQWNNQVTLTGQAYLVEKNAYGKKARNNITKGKAVKQLQNLLEEAKADVVNNKTNNGQKE